MSHLVKLTASALVVLVMGCRATQDNTVVFDQMDVGEIANETISPTARLAPLVSGDEEIGIDSDFFATGYSIPEGYGLGDSRPIIPHGGSQSWFVGSGFSYEFIHAAEHVMSLVQAKVSWPVERAASEQTTDVLIAYDDSAPSSACDGSAHGQCWYANTECVNKLPELLDDEHHRPCAKWVITITEANVQAWSDVNGFNPTGQFEAIVMHEFGHTLGFSHLPKNGETTGIMKPFVQESYISIGYTPCELAQLKAYHQVDDAGIHMVLPEECSL